MVKKCREGLCPGPPECFLKAYLEKPGPTPPGYDADDVNAARRMKKCVIRDKLKEQYPTIFEEADRLRS